MTHMSRELIQKTAMKEQLKKYPKVIDRKWQNILEKKQ